MFCPQCGANAADDAAFCGKCGYNFAVRSAEQPAAAQPAVGGNPVPGAAPAPAGSAYPGASASQSFGAGGVRPAPAVSTTTPAYSHNTPRKPRSKAPFIAALVAVVVLAVGGFAIWKIFFAPYNIDDRTFPDATVRVRVAEQADLNKDGKISREEAGLVNELSIDQAVEVSGLGIFPNLHVLNVSGSSLTKVDVTDCAALVSLTGSYCDNLATVALGDKQNLNNLSFSEETVIGELDVTRAPELFNLTVHSSALNSLDLTANEKLSSLNVEDCALTGLDLSHCAALTSLNAEGTSLASLDVSANTNLSDLALEQTVAVSGLEATGLHESWLVTNCEISRGTMRSVNGYSLSIKASYDSHGRLVKATRTSKTEDISRSETSEYEYTYNDDGQMTSVAVEPGNGGTPDHEWDLYYNEAGALIRAESTHGLNYSYGYDDAGQLTSAIESRNSRSSSDLRFSLTYGDKGLLAQVAKTDGSSPTKYWNLVYEGDQITGLTTQASNSSSENEIYGLAYEGGALTAVNYDARSNIMGQYSESLTYNTNGQLMGATRNCLPGGNGFAYAYPVINSTQFTYDEAGRLVSWEALVANAAKGLKVNLTYERYFTSEPVECAAPFLVAADPLTPLTNFDVWNPARFIDTQQLAFMNSPLIEEGLCAPILPEPKVTMQSA